MTNVARLSSIGTCFAFEFDDYTNTSFSMTGLSTVFASEFDENTADPPTLSGNQRMSATSTGGLIVLDSINEIDPFEDITTTNLELHLDSVDSNFSAVPVWEDLTANSRDLIELMIMELLMEAVEILIMESLELLQELLF
jgi:hypothetical protein